MVAPTIVISRRCAFTAVLREGIYQDVRLSVGFVTTKDDVHALIIREYLTARGVQVSIIESDQVSGSELVSWRMSTNGRPVCYLRTNQSKVPVADLDVIWWRRAAKKQTRNRWVNGPESDLVDRDSEAALAGSLLTCFDGVWISNPGATHSASNKLVQLAAARARGLPVPSTLVTQSREEIADFLSSHGGRVVVKSVQGLPYQTLYTRIVTHEHLSYANEVRASPAIYQEYIQGGRHLRCLTLGGQAWFFEIESEDLDWREDPNPRIVVADVCERLVVQALGLTHDLGLIMGVHDFKIASSGEPIWLEINPQGQFLFLQEATGIDLASAFGDFMLSLPARIKSSPKSSKTSFSR